jgi:hypothetical protein
VLVGREVADDAARSVLKVVCQLVTVRRAGMVGKQVNVSRKGGYTVALCLIIFVCLACTGLFLLPPNVNTPPLIGQVRAVVLWYASSWLSRMSDTSAARRNVEQYLMVISQSNAAAALQACPQADPTILAGQITRWGGADIQELRFAPLERMYPSYGPTQYLDVRFSYRHPGQTAWKRGSMRMFWMFRDGTFWIVPSSESCRGPSGWEP